MAEAPITAIAPAAAGSAVRHVLNGLGVLLVSWGITDASAFATMLNTLEIAAGAALTVGTLAWSWWEKWQARRALVIAAGSPKAAVAAIVVASGSPAVADAAAVLAAAKRTP